MAAQGGVSVSLSHSRFRGSVFGDHRFIQAGHRAPASITVHLYQYLSNYALNAL